MENLTILTLAHNLSSSSSSSNSSLPPTALTADLAHYRDHFSKLRFSYLEQVTKERFLRAIVADPPEFADAAENSELEGKIVRDKAVLKAKKEEVRGMCGELEEQGRLLAGRYEQLELRQTLLATLPEQITELERTIQTLRFQESEQKNPRSEEPDCNLPLPASKDLLQQREQELTSLELEIQRLEAALPAQKAEVKRLRDELAPVQLRKIKATEEAEDARRRRAEGGGDELEERGRWLRGVEGTLKAALEV
ncbi:uncharacterized protein RCC_00399 [Ramularia collo-cygni]|uniref:Kinetochore protein Sos7 coiled-coil domain-containing protein n=1 Tax=Ramularia collo-cygni TaxID=112498 RepID=A0A2D3ULB9_9PEZI|nr:uncharacterized protein RCC_00399 [Ramularia collo-cygni]CZT14422.1 uncharacterized protein RCC_00399 [Ramularia collo-cygni]